MSDTTSATTEAPVTWSTIDDAGGIRAWVDATLIAKGLSETGLNPATLSAKQRKQFKARREEERRVRKQLFKRAWQLYRGAHLVHIGVGHWYHDTPDHDRYDIDNIDDRRIDNDLPALPDATALANALGLSMSRLRWLVYHRDVDTNTHYHRWLVPKRSGGQRLISAPKPELKAAQTWIARNITEHLPVHGAAHGFLPGRSTLTNALPHVGANVLIKFDLTDFYPSITTPRVKGLFRKAGYGEQVATLLAMLTTESPREALDIRGKTHYVAIGPRSLPQGAPTSPSITNTLCRKLDARLAGLSRTFELRYTRYADDLSFSWHQGTHAPFGRLSGAVERIVTDEGFTINEAKTRILRAGRRQRITGLIINRLAEGDERPGARVPRKLTRQLRTLIHKREQGKPTRESLAQLRGWAAYVYMTDPERGAVFLERLSKVSGEQS